MIQLFTNRWIVTKNNTERDEDIFTKQRGEVMPLSEMRPQVSTKS